jgi:hypothetical protein
LQWLGDDRTPVEKTGRVFGLESRAVRAKSKIPNPKSQIPNPKSKIKNQKSKIKNRKSPNPQIPKSKIDQSQIKRRKS